MRRYYNDEARAAIQARVGKIECWQWGELELAAHVYDLNTHKPTRKLNHVRENLKDALAASETMLSILANKELCDWNLLQNSNKALHYLIRSEPPKQFARLESELIAFREKIEKDIAELDGLTDMRSYNGDDAESDLKESIAAIGFRLFGASISQSLIEFMELALQPILGENPDHEALRVFLQRHKKWVYTPS
jgi:hypothetical protein